MSQKGLMIWALAASFIAVGAIGYSLGQHKSNSSADIRAAVSATESPLTTEPGAGAVPVPEYVIPASFAEVPSEWRSDVTGDVEGYSVLFDPLTRQAIVESCRHNGYQLDDAGRPLELFGEFCTTLLQGELQSLTEKEATVRAKDGRIVTVELKPDMTRQPATLRLEFDGHTLALIPGSRNDLLQIMEREPVVLERKRRYFAAANARERGTVSDDNATTERNN